MKRVSVQNENKIFVFGLVLVVRQKTERHFNVTIDRLEMPVI